MIKSVRTVLRKSLRSLGLERIHHPSFVDLILHEKIETVFDVGANEGHFGVDLRERGYKGRILSFEPIPAVHAVLQARAAADPLWETFQLGVGDAETELEISVAAAPVFSSFKPVSDYTAGKFVGAREERREKVPVIRLDRFLDDRPDLLAGAYLKIDTQGFEKEVLAGCGDRLRQFRAVQLEVPLRRLYEGQETLVGMIQWMDGQGFEIAMAKENGFDWDILRLLELDIVFVRKPD